MDDNGNGFSDDVAQAIIYAIDQGADVINMSLGTSGDDPLVRAAVDIAFENNVVVVAAAGNCGIATSGACSGQRAGYVTFPANYNRVIAVGATDSNNNRASFSSYGERLDVMAPGAGTLISTTWSNNNATSLYASTLNGTSYASPIVASTAALIRSIRPETSIDDVRALIMAGSTKLGPMSGAFYTQSYGHGLLNVGKSIQVADELNTSGEVEPSLQQTGGPAAEHIYASTDILGSGCIAPQLTWCTVWLRHDGENYERFLPYTKTSSSGLAGWSFSAAALNKGPWTTRARQGDILSTIPYELLKK
jgi:subtilisin family serine protease